THVTVAQAGGRREEQTGSTQVWFRSLAPEEGERYWRSGEPEGKAGAYAIQGLGAAFIERIDGSYSAVMGLPLFETARLLACFGVRVV
ncbi:MAG: Maf family protein, partial [Pseudomonadota bacterium]